MLNLGQKTIKVIDKYIGAISCSLLWPFKFLKKKPADALVFDANFLSSTLKQKYKIKE